MSKKYDIKTANKGFTLIELLIFIVVSGFVMSTVLLGAQLALRNAPNLRKQWIAISLARGCMERFLQARRSNGYTIWPCPSTYPATCPTSSGYSINVDVACTTWNSDTNYKTITVAVSGLASASLTAQIGDY